MKKYEVVISFAVSGTTIIEAKDEDDLYEQARKLSANDIDIEDELFSEMWNGRRRDCKFCYL